MDLIFKVVTALAVVVSALWLYFDPKFDSVLAFLISLAAFIGPFIAPKLTQKQPKQNQSVSDNSEGIQAGRDVNIKK